jgi:hypothetical protein
MHIAQHRQGETFAGIVQHVHHVRPGREASHHHQHHCDHLNLHDRIGQMFRLCSDLMFH